MLSTIRSILVASTFIAVGVLSASIDFKVARALPEGDVTCGSNVYTLSEIESAVSGGSNHLNDPIGDDSYPHIYHDYENLDMFCSGDTWYEYPILDNGEAYSGGSPGADRVIFNPSGTYCAVITHTGASDDDFVACNGD